MALNFSYTLSPDENASWTKFKDFAKKVSGQEIKINLDIAGGNTNVDPLKKIVENVDRSGKALTSKVELIQERLYNSLNNLTIKADKNLLEGILPIDEISKQIDSLANSGKSLNQIRTEASQIRIELQQWGQVLSNDKALLEGINDLQGNIGKKIDEISKKKNSKHITQLKQETDEWLKSEIEAIKKTKEFQAATESQKSAFDKLTNSMEINAYSVEGLNKQKEQLNQQLKEQQQLFRDRYVDEARRSYDDLQSSIKNLVVRYVSLQAILHNMKNYFQDAVQYTMDLDNAYTDVAISMDVTRQEFNEWTKTARQIAQANGQTTTSLMEMVKIYATAGESIEAVQDKLAGTAMIQNITQWDAEQTTSAVNSILNQYKLLEKEINGVTGNVSNAITYLGDNLIGISNALEIDNVKGIQEMVSAIDTSGSIVESAGGTMEWYMGITGALGEAMNATGAEVGNAMKMIAARTLQQKQVIEDMGESVENFEIETANAEKALNDIGVSIRGQGGELRNLEDILGDVAAKWNDLSDSTQQFVGEKLAGNNRRSYFTAMMENYARVLELQEAGLNSSGELVKANEIRVESLAGQINILKDKMLAFSDGLQPVIAGGVQLASTLMDLVNSFGAIPTTITLAGTSLLTFTDRGKQARDMMLTLGESHIKAIGNINTYIAKNKVKIEDMKNEIAVAQQTINQTLRDIEVRKSQDKSITNLVTNLKTEQAALRTTQIELAKTTIKTYALQTAMSFGLSVAISTAISLAGKLVSAFKEFNHGRTLEGITESIGSLNEKVNSYTDSVEKLNNVKADVSSMRKMVETINDENTSIEKQQELTNSVNEMLSGHASSYESIESVLNNENIALGTRIDLLEQEAELQRQLKANEVMEEVSKTDLFGNTTFDNAMSQTENLANQLINAKKALDNKVSDIENGVVYSINGKAGYIADASKEFTERVDSLVTDIKTSATNAGKIMNDYMTLRDAGRIDNTQFEALKQQYLDTIKELKQALAEVGKEDVEIFNLFGEEQMEKMETTVDKALQLKEKISSQFDQSYVNPLGFGDIASLDETIDKYQELYAANESLIDILNEGNGIEFKDGHPFSKSFGEILDSDLSSLEDFQGALFTINELFEDMSSADLTEMFGADLASQIQEVLDIDLSTPFDEMSDAAKQAVEGVIGTFGNMEEELKGTFYRLNATNEEFYEELRERNSQVFDSLYERWGVSADQYANVAEYKRAVDQQVYTELMQMDADTLNQLYQNTLTLLGIKEEAGEERVSMEDQAAFLINGIDIQELKAKLENEKKILEAKKAQLEGELEAEESQANNSLDVQNQAGVKSLQMMNELSNRASSHYNSFYGSMSSTGALDGVAISAMTGRATVNTSSLSQGNVTAKALQSVTDKIAKIDGILGSLDSYEKLSSGDLNFTITPYNPSNSSTTSSGGYKPSNSKGSGGSKGSSSEKVVKDLKLTIDRYYELNDALDDVNNALELNRQLQESATNVETTKKLHKEEIKLLNDKLEATKKLYNEQRNEMLDNKNVLSSAGFKFDKEGNLTNYASRLKELQNYANSLTGEAKEAQIEYVNSIMDVIDAYTTLTNDTLPSTSLSIEELTQEIKDVNKEHEKTLKLVEALGDRYYEINGLINDVDKKLAINQAKQQNATASERVKLMQEEIDLMKEKQDLLVQQGNELKVEADELKKKLSEQGVEFNTDGTIKNYKQLMDKYKTIASQYVGDSRDEVLDEAEELIDLIEKYDDIIRNSLPDLVVEWEDYTASIKKAEETMAQTVTNVQKDITSAIENELQKRTDAVKTELQKQKDLYNKQFDEEDWEDSLNSEQRKLDEIQQQINNLSRDTSLAGQLKLQQLRDEYEAQQKVINDMIRDKEKENGNNRFDEEMEKIDKELEEALDPQNIADLVNKALVDGFVTIGDEVVALDTLMSDWLDETGDGLYAIGDLLREELIENIRTAQELMAGMGITSTGVTNSGVQLEQGVLTKDLENKLNNALTTNTNNSSQNLDISIGSLIEVKGNVTEDVLPKLESMIEVAKTELIDEIASEIMKR
nr:MAG TPA: minor tail protein [Bacteriophage sp.]